MVAGMGRLSLRKGEGEREGFVSRQTVGTGKCEPLTFILSPSPRAEAKKITV